MECGICLDDGVDVITNCKHKFHSICIRTWFQRNPSCPNCRTRLHVDQIRRIDHSPLTYGQIDHIMKIVYDCVSQVRGTSVNHYTDDFVWSSLQNEWKRLSDGHRYTPNSTRDLTFECFKVDLKVCSRSIQLLHAKTKRMFVHLDSYLYIDLNVRCGTWRVRPAFYCTSICKFVTVNDSEDTLLGALIPLFWEDHDSEPTVNHACKVVWLSFYDWLRCHVECNPLSVAHADASLYTV